MTENDLLFITLYQTPLNSLQCAIHENDVTKSLRRTDGLTDEWQDLLELYSQLKTTLQMIMNHSQPGSDLVNISRDIWIFDDNIYIYINVSFDYQR